MYNCIKFLSTTVSLQSLNFFQLCGEIACFCDDLINGDQHLGTGLPKFLSNDLHAIYKTTAIKIYVALGSTLASSAIFSRQCFRKQA
jgi:hypothetical protein